MKRELARRCVRVRVRRGDANWKHLKLVMVVYVWTSAAGGSFNMASSNAGSQDRYLLEEPDTAVSGRGVFLRDVGCSSEKQGAGYFR